MESTNTEKKTVTFYCCNSDRSLKLKPSRWRTILPYADRNRDPVTWRMVYDPVDVRTISFVRWVYETSNELEIEYLRMYNKWGTLSNWKWFSGNTYPLILEEQAYKKEQVKETVVTKTVEKEVLPKFIAESLTIADLKRFADKVWCKEALKEDVAKKADILKVLDNNKFIVD